MPLSRDNSERRDSKNLLVAVAIDRDKGSQQALKWAIGNLLQRGQTVVLVHVKFKDQPSNASSTPYIPTHGSRQLDRDTAKLFLPFSCLCTRNDIKCHKIMLEDMEVPKALIEFVAQSAIDVLVMGAASKGSFLSIFNKADNPTLVAKGAPDFCTVYIISQGGKISSKRPASRQAPLFFPSLRNQIMNQQPATSTLTSQRPKKTPPSVSQLGVTDDMEFGRLGLKLLVFPERQIRLPVGF